MTVRRIGLTLGLLLVFAAWPAARQNPRPPTAVDTPVRNMDTEVVLKPWTGDFDGMMERRHIRVLVPYSRTFFFNELGRERGYAADLVRVFEKYINQKFASQLGKRPITVLMIPTTRDRLFSGVAQGQGDIAVGNLTVTDERRKTVDFVTAPDTIKLAEVALTGPKSPAIAVIDDLSGKAVHARPSSSYHESLLALNDRFDATYWMLIAGHAHLGERDRARDWLRALLAIAPDVRLSRIMAAQSSRFPERFAPVAEGLRLAGFPD